MNEYIFDSKKQQKSQAKKMQMAIMQSEIDELVRLRNSLPEDKHELINPRIVTLNKEYFRIAYTALFDYQRVYNLRKAQQDQGS